MTTVSLLLMHGLLNSKSIFPKCKQTTLEFTLETLEVSVGLVLMMKRYSQLCNIWIQCECQTDVSQ